ncbi:MAG: ribonuclease catalytic domain-containing protein [bacterium]
MKIAPGDIVELFEQKRMMTGLCLETKNHKLTVLTEIGKTMLLPQSRILHRSRIPIDAALSKEEIITKLKELSALRNQISEVYDLENIWKKIDLKQQTLIPAQLTHLFPNSAIEQADREAGFLRAVFFDKRYFKIVDGFVYVFSEAEAQENIAQIKAQQKELDIADKLVRWLEKKIQYPEIHDPFPEGYDRLIEVLKADVVNASVEPADKNLISSVMRRIPTEMRMPPFDILVLLGEFEPDENLDLIKFRYPKEFSKESYDEIQYLLTNPFTISRERTNFEDLPCITIDNQDTLDCDDALSFEILPENRFEIGIHISDVCHWIHPGSFLDEEARERGQTLYLPTKTWHMFPPIFAETIAGLKTETPQPAISIFAVIAENGAIESSRFYRSTIRVCKRLTHDDVDNEIEKEPYVSLLKIVNNLQRNRLDNGAVIMPRPEITIDAKNPDKLVIHRRNRQTASQLIVSELMILANSLIAGYAAQSDIAFPYRHQKKAEEAFPKSGAEFDPYISYCQKKVIPRADYSLKAKPHATLGLQYYTNMTSPIRRYFDVLAQRQFLSLLGFDDPYPRHELADLLKDLEISIARATTISMHQHRYWLLKYLAAFTGKTVNATVLDRITNGYQIWLEELCFDTFLPLSFSHKLLPGQAISVVIERVVPRDNYLKLRLRET